MPVLQLSGSLPTGILGWLFIGFILLYELYMPKIAGRETALSPIIHDVPDKVDELSKNQDELKEDVCSLENNLDDVAHSQEMTMQVQRAQARANPQMNHEKVDEYLIQNGADIDTFLRGSEMDGYGNWTEVGREDDSGKQSDDLDG